MASDLYVNDPRSRRLVLLADYYVNPGRYRKLPNDSSVYEFLADAGYGLIKMPPPNVTRKELREWVRIAGDQIQEYTNRGFALFLLGVKSLPQGGLWLAELKRELASRRVHLPPVVMLPTKTNPRKLLEERLQATASA